MNKPIPPKKPIEPKKPDTHVRKVRFSYHHDDEYSVGATVDHISQDIQKRFNQSFDINNLYIKLEHGYYGDVSIETYYEIDIPKKATDYKKDIDNYNKRLKNYPIQEKEYKEKYKQYLKELRKYREFVKQEELSKKKKLYDELKKEFENVKN